MHNHPAAEEIEIQTRYLRLAARAWGPADGAPVLALHGWLDNAASFDHLAPLLPGVRLVALDLPGHGLSGQRPPGVHYHFVDFVEDVIAAAEALGWERFSLLGHSLGAGIASFVAAVIPGQVARLALIEGLGPLSGKPADAPAALAKAVRQMARLQLKRLPRYASLQEAIQARSDAGQLSWQAAATLAARGIRTVDTGFGWRSDPRLTFTSPVYLTEEQVLEFLGRIAAPALLILGEAGYLIRREFMAARYARVPQIEVAVLAGGHYPHLEEPRSAAQIIGRFLATA